MRRSFRRFLGSVWVAGLIAVVTAAPQPVVAADPIAVLLDGERMQLTPSPINVEGRNLVPLRAVAEKLGAEVAWDSAAQAITITRGPYFLGLRLGRRLACLDRQCRKALTLDQAPRSVGDRTFVPVRLITEAMGIGVDWDNDRRAVLINTTQPASGYSAPVTTPTVHAGQIIDGPTLLKADGPAGNHVRFYLINPTTGTGPIIAVGPRTDATYTYTPDPAVIGPRLIVAEIRDDAGGRFFSHPLAVEMQPTPRVELRGIEPGGTVGGITSLSSWVSFVATQVNWRLLDADGSVLEELGSTGPGDSFTWYPGLAHNGSRKLQLTALDRYGNRYESTPVPVQVQTERRTFVNGLKDGGTVTGPVGLSVSTNYPASYVQYYRDGQHYGWGYAQSWQVTAADNGPHTWSIEIGHPDGTALTLGPYHVTVNVTPRAWFSGVGPDQVVTGAVSLQSGSNVPIVDTEFMLTNRSTGQLTSLGRIAPGVSLRWNPPAAGDWTLQAQLTTADGATLITEKVNFKVYLGFLYSPRPVIPKPDFKATASSLAVRAYERTGMSAALQVAQAILESGWGQSVPVDKYTGQVSNNLFGIKGTGPAGSVVHSTWEEYNGLSYRIDANFRAYHSIEESWDDHKTFLLVRSYYVPFRAVMADPVLGAWGLKKSGYATDSAYPGKLINLMKQQDLFRLDELPL